MKYSHYGIAIEERSQFYKISSPDRQHLRIIYIMSVSMNALVLHGPGDLRHERVDKPEASAGSVIVRVIAAPIWDYVVRMTVIL